MLTNHILSCYNHLLATSILYLSIVDPLQDLANTLSNYIEKDHHHHHLTNFVLAETNSEQSYYDILGVNKDATKHDIHKAFRQLAKKYHPDKNKDKGAQDEFIRIFKAYETLSDEKKRKEYDEQSSGRTNQFNGWQTTSSMNDFDINEFFKQYEDQFLKHAQHFGHHQHRHYNQHQNYHHNHHDRFTFHGVNLDDLFHDIDEDEYNSFGRLFEMSGHNHNLHESMDGTFGDGASYFGTHFPSQIHDTIHHYQHQQSHQSSNRGGYSCQTITRQVNGMIMTQTSCA